MLWLCMGYGKFDVKKVYVVVNVWFVFSIFWVKKFEYFWLVKNVYVLLVFIFLNFCDKNGWVIFVYF